MRKFKFITPLLGLAALSMPCTALVSCSKKTYMFKNMRSLLPYLHYVEYNGLSLDHTDEFNKYIEELFGDEFVKYSDTLTLLGGCSSIRNGNFYGRNLDFFYSDTAEFMIRMLPDKSKNRYESLGMAKHPYFTEQDILHYEKTGKYDEELNYLPNLTTDGINENGVVCSINVVASEDCGDISHTNEGKGYEEMMMMYAPRLVLDHATSAKHALELLQAKDIVMSEDLLKMTGFAVHNVQMMIADKDETYIVVPFDGSLRFMRTKQTTQPNGNILTNYYLQGEDFISEDEIKASYETEVELKYYKGYHKNAMGYERYEILEDWYGDTNSLQGMFRALQDVKSTNIYIDPVEPNWPSEDLDQTVINDETKFNQWKTGEGWDEEKEGSPSYPNLYKTTIDILINQKRDESLENDV